MVGVTERCEIQAGSGDEAVEQARRYGIGLSRDFASAVSRLRVRLAAAASRCGGWPGGAGARAESYDVVVRLLSLGQQRPYGQVVAGRPAGGPGGPRRSHGPRWHQ